MKKVVPVLLCMVFLTAATLSWAKDVYVTANGKKYHTEDCHWVQNREVKKITEEEALQKGLTPCGRCMKEAESAVKNSPAAKAVESKDAKVKK